MDLIEKLQKVVQQECDYAEKNGASRLSTCGNHNWDQDIWNHREDIIDGIKRRGYRVSSSVNWGVLDIVTTKVLTL